MTQPFNINIIRAQITVLENLMIKTDKEERQPAEAKQVANDILRRVRRMKLKEHSYYYTNSAYVYESYSYECLGHVCQREAVKVCMETLYYLFIPFPSSNTPILKNIYIRTIETIDNSQKH